MPIRGESLAELLWSYSPLLVRVRTESTRFLSIIVARFAAVTCEESGRICLPLIEILGVSYNSKK